MPEPPRQPVFFFAGGGTGGHLYPGLAIAEELRARVPDSRCIFLCSDRAIDSKILGAAGAEFVVIPAKPPVLRPRAMLRFLGSWGKSLRAARGVIANARRANPGTSVVMTTMGGFVAAPCARAAHAECVPVAMVNLDAVPGKANRMIARSAKIRLSATGDGGSESEVPRGWEWLPPIVRRAALPKATREDCRVRLGLDPSRSTLLITGGSQGAGSINNLMAALAASRASIFNGWQLFHQCGEGAEADLRAAYESSGIAAKVVPFCNDMGSAWGAADLAISRSGAGTVGEAWAAGVPCVFMPYPYHRDQHQRINALPLVKAGGSLVVKDEIDAARNVESMAPILEELLQSESKRATMHAAMRSLGPADGATRIADRLLQLAQSS
ncbi:MAG TPA: UDP-N-acetylglucosamine--N-acetylmuramyl-(pentapeptide) pyrophosphoryl-undecaprenol N-acetylglucosamine transferase [Phycisphaerales bacterium]|nr:UDP-N-acetylglucosamine--N-acetylmuramyl-(pentapeptide) pyrophosphoryl-undecaprenol N-acetylglucosamine transferase [Phycisphaerales bacterium]